MSTYLRLLPGTLAKLNSYANLLFLIKSALINLETFFGNPTGFPSDFREKSVTIKPKLRIRLHTNFIESLDIIQGLFYERLIRQSC